jgi:electron transport complex protein RnfC
MDERNPVHTIVIYGGNADLLIDTSLYVLKNNAEAVNSGIEVLRKATGIEDIVIVVPEESVQNYSGHLDARIQSISSAYPYAQPLMVLHHLTGRLPDEKGMASMGVHLIRAEAVAAIGQAFSSGNLPVEKTVAVIDKQRNQAPGPGAGGHTGGRAAGTFGVEVNDQDKIIFGGPMTGNAIYSEDPAHRAGHRCHHGSGQKRHPLVQRLSVHQLRRLCAHLSGQRAGEPARPLSGSRTV